MLRRNKHQKKDENKTPDLGVKNKPKVSDFFRKILSSNPSSSNDLESDSAIKIQNLIDKPLNFLQRFAISPSASPSITSKTATFYLINSNSGLPRLPKMNPRLRITDKVFPNEHGDILYEDTFDAVVLPVQNSDNDEINFTDLPDENNIMVTTQLTGCCIVVIPSGNSYKLAHIRPTNETGSELEERLRNKGWDTYGRESYGDHRATFLGIKDTSSGWSFYTQEQDINFQPIKAEKFNVLG